MVAQSAAPAYRRAARRASASSSRGPRGRRPAFAQKIAALGAHADRLSGDRDPAAGRPRAARARARGARRLTTSRSSYRPTRSNTARRTAGAGRATLIAFAPGPGTAEALAAVGIVDARIPATTFDSEGLLALPELADVRRQAHRDLSRRRRARAARRHAARARRGRGYVACYRRAAARKRAPQGLPKPFATAASTR